MSVPSHHGAGALAKPIAAVAFAAMALAISSCSSAAPMDREQWEQRSHFLLHPLCNESRVGCSELVIELSPNYFPNIGRPAIDPSLQSERKTSADGIDEYVWSNRVGGLQGAVVLTIGQTDEITEGGIVRGKGTTFTALGQVTLRVHTKGLMEARLDVTASGRPLVMSMGGKVRDLQSFELRNGVLHAP